MDKPFSLLTPQAYFKVDVRIITSGNMPAGTDNHENRTLIPQMHADQH
jgi:hypothetical protein